MTFNLVYSTCMTQNGIKVRVETESEIFRTMEFINAKTFKR